MKICYFANVCVHTRNWIEYFAKNGHEMHIMTYFPDQLTKVKIHPLGQYSKFNFLSNLLNISNKIRKVKPSVIHVHGVGGYGFYLSLLPFPFIVSSWGSDIATSPDENIARKYFTKFVLKRAKYIHVADGLGLQQALKLGAPKNKTIVIPWGVKLNLFSPKNRSKQFQKKLQTRPGKVITIIFNRDADAYAEVIACACNKVLEKFPNTNFLIVNSLRSEVFDSATFRIINKIPYSEMPLYLANSDIVVDPYSPLNWHEKGHGFGMMLLEAMASGTRVIATKRQTILWGLAKKLYFGSAYKYNDSAELAKVITKQMLDQQNTHIKNNLRSIQINFDWEKTVTQIEKLYFTAAKLV